MAVVTKKIHDLAKEYKVSAHAMLKIVQDMGYPVKSHMAAATPDIVNAVSLKFAQERRQAKLEMEQKRKAALDAERHRLEIEARAKAEAEAAAKAAAEANTLAKIDGLTRGKLIKAAPPKVAEPVVAPVVIPPVVVEEDDNLAAMLKKAEQKKKRKDRKKKKERRVVDQVEVAKSFRATMADLSGGKPKRKYKKAASDDDTGIENPNQIEVNEFMSVAELAKLMDHKPAEVVAKLMELGMLATINQRLDMDTIEMVASEFGYDVKLQAEIGEEAREEEHEEQLALRAPVVTVMGHVDHGKTSLLDYIRKTNVVAGEAGAITQHIGAYEVVHNDSRIVFLDTPGHEAFTAMRSRGTQITDIVVLIVAADEGVRPQTIEAIDHARAAGVPIVVAISKIDKPGANPDEVRNQLAKQNLLVEAWGGKTIAVNISSKSGEGIDKLLEMILLQAEMLDLKADPSIRGQGVVVDSKLEKGRGPVATVLIQRGTLRVGDPIVAGVYSGHVRTVHNDRDQRLDTIGPSTPAQVTGLSGVPQAGDSFLVVKDDQEAREITARRGQIKREYDARRPQGAISLDKVFSRIQEGQIQEVRLIIKADVDGSAEVLADTLGKIETSEVKTAIIRRGVGPVTESDVLLAAASDAIIIGFQVGPDLRARELAAREKVDIRRYEVIYEAEEDVKKALEGLLAPTVSEQFVGMAEVREIFKVPRVGVIAGCYVREGRVSRKDRVRLTRDGKTVYTGNIASLKRFKDDAREVKEGFECGIGIENFNDIKVGDMIEAIEVVETARTLG
ncbi:MAG: translation initiation factor IF-2 [Candidatus Zixiibacteriota bacterium]